MTTKIYISEPWPIGRCSVCQAEQEIVATARSTDGSTGLCCESCFQQLPEKPE